MEKKQKLKINKLLLLIIVFIAGYLIYETYHRAKPGELSGNDAIISNAFENHLQDIPVHNIGIITKILPDDNAGSRHQRFIIRLNSGQTLLIAHNIDMAPRITNITAGDTIEFRGEYEWDPEGGVIHWTHHDPEGRHKAGWIKHAGQVYQ